VSPINRLEIHLRVPVAVIDDDCVRAGQVDTKATWPRAKQEHEIFAFRAVELFNAFVPMQQARFTINSGELEFPICAEILKNVKHPHHLTKQ